jgi:hypothetical protein
MPIQAKAMNQHNDRFIDWPDKFVNTSITAGSGHENDCASDDESPNLTQLIIN